MKWSFEVIGLVPEGAVTLTSTAPGMLGGATAVIWVAESTLKLVASVAPKETAVAPVRSSPVIVTAVPPAAGPFLGESFLMLGVGAAPAWIVLAVPMLVPSEAKTVRATV